MNRNPKEKLTRIDLRVSPQEKKKIERIAKTCGLSTAEYFRKRALRFVPKPAAPDAFYLFHEKLCELLNRELSPETEAAALKLFDDIHHEIVGTPKQTAKQIQKECDAMWQPPDSGP